MLANFDYAFPMHMEVGFVSGRT